MAGSAEFAAYRDLLHERFTAVATRLLTAPLSDADLRETRARLATYIEIAEFLDTLLATTEAQHDDRAQRQRAPDSPERGDARFFGNPLFFDWRGRWQPTARS